VQEFCRWLEVMIVTWTNFLYIGSKGKNWKYRPQSGTDKAGIACQLLNEKEI